MIVRSIHELPMPELLKQDICGRRSNMKKQEEMGIGRLHIGKETMAMRRSQEIVQGLELPRALIHNSMPCLKLFCALLIVSSMFGIANAQPSNDL